MNATQGLHNLEQSFQYDAKHVVGVLRARDGTYEFAFQAFCFGCTPGVSPIDTGKGMQLENEYRDFEGSLSHFDQVFQRINQIASEIRFSISPKTEPTAKDPKEAMSLYGDLNRRFAELCPLPSKNCFEAYAKYQACKSRDPLGDCGDPPNCSAVCVVTPDALRSLKATSCMSRLEDTATLIPDWSEVAKKLVDARATNDPVDPKTVQITTLPQGAPRNFMGKPLQPDNPCNVGDSYAMAMSKYVADKTPSPQAGTLSLISGASTAGSGKITAPPELMARNLISGEKPLYPAVAKAARIEGTVVLRATISRQGEIEDLKVLRSAS